MQLWHEKLRHRDRLRRKAIGNAALVGWEEDGICYTHFSRERAVQKRGGRSCLRHLSKL